MYFAYSLPDDPIAREIAAKPIERVFFDEFMRSPWRRETALFEGAGDGAHLMLLIAPTLEHMPHTKDACAWRAIADLPEARWMLATGCADAWDTFSVPRSGRAL